MPDERFGTRLRHAWNVFRSRDPTKLEVEKDLGYGSYRRPDAMRLHITNERSVVISVYNRIAMDVAAVSIQHILTDENKMFSKAIDSDLNYCLTQEANVDQTSKVLFHDIVMSLFDEGAVAVVPVETDGDPDLDADFDVLSLRVGRIIKWFPRHVRVRLYDDRTGEHQEVTVSKESTAIIENPLYSVMNEPNSTLKRLLRKLSILDAIDEQSGAGKLDIIIQLPYVIKTEARKAQAEQRRKDIEVQLANSKYGIAYTDGTERITQLNRPAENNLMAQIQYLTSTFYNQLGITQGVFDGTADEKTMLNYTRRSVIPFLDAIVDEFKRKFLSREARKNYETIAYFEEPFKFVSSSDLANLADKLTRNEILTSNEFRAILGYKPSKDPGADELRNKNLNSAKPTAPLTSKPDTPFKMEGE